MTYPVAPEPTTTISTITVSDLQARLDDPELTLLDVRPIAAYNGWRLGAETRGGHIPGAAAFPVGWLDAQEAAETARLLADKGATAGRAIVVYGHGRRRRRPPRPPPGRRRARGERPRGRVRGLGRRRRRTRSTASATTSAWSTSAG